MGFGNNELVFICFGEALSAPEVAWDLLAHGFQVMAFCRRGSSPSLRHIKEIKLIGVTPPETDAWETVEQIRAAIQATGAKTLMPLDDASVWLCNKASNGLNVPMAGATGTAACLALDKKFQLEMARESGFNVPETEYISAPEEILRISRLPVVLKPAAAILETKGRLRKGSIYFCIGKDDLSRAAAEWNQEGQLIAQPIVAGTGEGIFGLHLPDGVKNWSAHRRVRMINPLGSGSSACKSLEISDQPILAAERMLEKVKWPGQFMIELLRDTAGKLWFMELNGRSWGSMALAIRLGLHYPAWTVMQTLDPSYVPPASPPWKPILCRHLGREIIHLLAVLRGKKAYRLVPGYSRVRTISEVCRFSRSEAWYNLNPGYQLLFWEDTFKTVAGKLLAHRG